MSKFAFIWGLLFVICHFCPPAEAHELRPAYLQVRETGAESYDVLWKVPGRGDSLRLSLYVQVPEGCSNLTEPRGYFADGAFIESWTMRCQGGLTGRRIHIIGLAATLTDVLARLERLDGTAQVVRLMPSEPSFVVEAVPGRAQVAVTYLKLGIEHILTGIDHLLFVLALIIITLEPGRARHGKPDVGRGMRDENRTSRIPDLGSHVGNFMPLIKTVSAFTVSHSITLTAATLGFVHVPQRPVEAVIALSIVFVAMEIVKHRVKYGMRDVGYGIRDTGYELRDKDPESRIPQPVSRNQDLACQNPPPESRISHRNSRIAHPASLSLTMRQPWIVAFTFGLLHGLGFAGGLSEIGLPQQHIPLALLFFSAGVETGHLLFVAAVLVLIWLSSSALSKIRDTGYAIRDTSYEIKIPNLASRNPYLATRISHLKTRHPNLVSRIANLASRIPRLISRIPYRATRIPHPVSRIPHLESAIIFVSAYAIGGMAMFWVIQRIAAF